MPKKKYPKFTKDDYNAMYMKVYYWINRERLLAHAKRPVECDICGKTMPYSSRSYHRKKCHMANPQPKPKPLKYELTKQVGNFKINFD
jgi:ribosomal protein S27E